MFSNFGFFVYLPEVDTVSPMVAAVVRKQLNNYVINKHDCLQMCEVR